MSTKFKLLVQSCHRTSKSRSGKIKIRLKASAGPRRCRLSFSHHRVAVRRRKAKQKQFASCCTSLALPCTMLSHPLRAMCSTLALLMLDMPRSAVAVTDEEYARLGRGAGLPHCECDVYHNGAWQWMSRMCMKRWNGMTICYPTHLSGDGHPGTWVNGIYHENWCEQHEPQEMCSPWSDPAPARYFDRVSTFLVCDQVIQCRTRLYLDGVPCARWA